MHNETRWNARSSSVIGQLITFCGFGSLGLWVRGHGFSVKKRSCKLEYTHSLPVKFAISFGAYSVLLSVEQRVKYRSSEQGERAGRLSTSRARVEHESSTSQAQVEHRLHSLLTSWPKGQHAWSGSGARCGRACPIPRALSQFVIGAIQPMRAFWVRLKRPIF